MMVTAFSASPRKGANSDILADAILRGAAEAGADTGKVKLHGLNIEPCRACDACQKSFASRCVIDDDMAEVLETLEQSDAIVLASPIYFFSVAAQMKVFLDRTYALGGGGRWDALAGRKCAVALTYGDSDPAASGVRNAIGMFEDAASFLGLSLSSIVHASCDAPGEVSGNPAALRDAEQAGRTLGSIHQIVDGRG
jgi:multimeric flavodoxin WrbA